MPTAKIRHSDQSSWREATRVPAMSQAHAEQIARQTMSLFQLSWADVQFDGGEIKTIYANEVARHNRELALRSGVRDSIE